MKNTLITIFLFTSFSAFSSDQLSTKLITGQAAEIMFDELNGASEYSAGAITDFIEYRMIVRQNDVVECQKATTIYNASNLVEVEFECRLK